MWEEMKQEYITNPKATHKGLAQKYGVNPTTVSKRASKEGWTQLRENYASETLEKTLKFMSTEMAQKSARLLNVSDKLLNRIESLVDMLDAETIMTDTNMLRHISSSIKNIKEIQMIKSDTDIREQEARIKILEKQVNSSGDDKERFGVLILPSIEGDKNE